MASDAQGKIVQLKAARHIAAPQSLLEPASDPTKHGLSGKMG
ncbi:hypothetical protein ACVWY2_003265 [Bradyrhizobium sp. JR6.1]